MPINILPMKAIFRSGFLALAISLVLAVPANAGPLEDAVDAYNRGHYFTALELWFRLSLAEQGNVDAQLNLARMYANGWSVKQDDAEAEKWYRKAAEQGIAEAQFILGGKYHNGRGVPQDHVEAVRWYRKAADQGYIYAQHILGLMYYQGKVGTGVPKDYALAYMWFNLAAALGDEAAPELRDNVAERMTPDQIAEAQRMAREWMEKHQQ